MFHDGSLFCQLLTHLDREVEEIRKNRFEEQKKQKNSPNSSTLLFTSSGNPVEKFI